MNLNLVLSNDAPAVESHQNVLISDLDKVPSRGCRSFILNHSINYLTDEQLYKVLDKIRHGGIVSITSPDAMEAASALCWGNIDMNAFSALTANKNKQYSIIEVKSLLEQEGYKIENATINELVFYIRAQRP